MFGSSNSQKPYVSLGTWSNPCSLYPSMILALKIPSEHSNFHYDLPSSPSSGSTPFSVHAYVYVLLYALWGKPE